MAPAAPMAPAWFTVAIPLIIDPRTKMIKVKGGNKVITTFIQNALSIFPLYGTGGAVLGEIVAITSIKSIYKATSNKPGIKAPKNISPALVEVTSKTDGIEKSPVEAL